MYTCNSPSFSSERNAVGMYLRAILLLALGWSATGTARAAPLPSRSLPEAPAEMLIPFEKFTLGNGLTVVVHTDRKAPIVAVNVWYHVGSKNEPEGRTGFAHLFEHLMFQGS